MKSIIRICIIYYHVVRSIWWDVCPVIYFNYFEKTKFISPSLNLKRWGQEPLVSVNMSGFLSYVFVWFTHDSIFRYFTCFKHLL